ncbi:MAG: hypothetical protein KAI29_10100, partial [Cyclobacteriaceae bacterium]|nr:hypothetical protein [Cyclobacteriaceae bacterium]
MSSKLNVVFANIRILLRDADYLIKHVNASGCQFLKLKNSNSQLTTFINNHHFIARWDSVYFLHMLKIHRSKMLSFD